MAQVSDNLQVVIGMIKDVIVILATHEVISKILFSATALLVLAIFLTIYRSMLHRMVEARRLQAEAATRLYRIVELMAVILILMAIAYFITRSHYLILFLTGLALVVVASSWEVIQNLVYYYIILFTGVVRPGNLIVLGDGRAGRVEDIRLMATVLSKPGNPRETYVVPNRLLLSRGFSIIDEACMVKIRVRVDGVTPESADTIRDVIEARVREISKGLAALVPLEHSYRAYVEEVTGNSMTLVVSFVTPPLEGREFRLTPLLYLLAVALRESGYTRFAVELAGVVCAGGKSSA